MKESQECLLGGPYQLKGGEGENVPETSEIWTHICSCHNFSPLSSVQFRYQLVAYCGALELFLP